MGPTTTNEPTLADFIHWYGDGKNGACPTAPQWERVLGRPADAPLTLVNLFKFRERAHYAGGVPGGGDPSGQAAFERYAAVSIPTMERIGGSFLYVGPYAGAFIGAEEDWDLVAIGAYPNLAALSALYGDADYREAFEHRTAAVATQKVFVCG